MKGGGRWEGPLIGVEMENKLCLPCSPGLYDQKPSPGHRSWYLLHLCLVSVKTFPLLPHLSQPLYPLPFPSLSGSQVPSVS